MNFKNLTEQFHRQKNHHQQKLKEENLVFPLDGNDSGEVESNYMKVLKNQVHVHQAYNTVLSAK